jgi:hypothetical protein
VLQVAASPLARPSFSPEITPEVPGPVSRIWWFAP